MGDRGLLFVGRRVPRESICVVFLPYVVEKKGGAGGGRGGGIAGVCVCVCYHVKKQREPHSHDDAEKVGAL